MVQKKKNHFQQNNSFLIFLQKRIMEKEFCVEQTTTI